jgi:hypothetical protein
VSRVRTPVVAGLAGGAGTSTLAAALHAHDAGRFDRAADVLVCTSTALAQAAALVPSPTTAQPVLAVTLDADGADRAAVAAQLAVLHPRFATVVALPHVAGWRASATARAEAGSVLTLPADRVPRPLRVYASGLRRIVRALTRSDLLTLAYPPAPVQPVLWCGLQPIERRPVHPLQPGQHSRPPEPDLDDDALEADQFGLAAGGP